MNWHGKIKTALSALAVAAVLTLLAGLGVLNRADRNVSDILCQRPVGTDGEIVIIAIDQKSLEAYGPYQEWCREGIARTLEMLNADPAARPAVIGIDVLFSGGTVRERDHRLRRRVYHGFCRNGQRVCPQQLSADRL